MNEETRSALRSDADRFRQGLGNSIWRIGIVALNNPGLLCVLLYRFQEAAVKKARWRQARFLRTVNHFLTGADLLPGSKIGGGLIIQHPNGIVIGAGATIGEHATVLQQVTVGEKLSSNHSEHAYPRIGDRCVLGAGAKILGGISIGDDVRIGANAVVLHDLPNSVSAVGIPAGVA